MGKEQRAVCSGGLAVAVEAAVWLKLGLSPEGGLASSTRHHKEDGPISLQRTCEHGQRAEGSPKSREKYAVMASSLRSRLQSCQKLGLNPSKIAGHHSQIHCVSENGGDKESARALVCRHPVPDWH